jgi:NTP pyrophosphatase (non-canonical NTP hydrolase)
MNLTLTTYERHAADTAIYPGAGTGELLPRSYVALKLAEEAGEVAGKLGKSIRDGWDNDSLVDALTAELGDVLWYVAAMAREIGVPLHVIAEYNLAKLASRAARGTIHGEGDER